MQLLNSNTRKKTNSDVKCFKRYLSHLILTKRLQKTSDWVEWVRLVELPFLNPRKE